MERVRARERAGGKESRESGKEREGGREEESTRGRARRQVFPLRGRALGLCAGAAG